MLKYLKVKGYGVYIIVKWFRKKKSYLFVFIQREKVNS